jgi:FG-GAP repeat
MRRITSSIAITLLLSASAQAGHDFNGDGYEDLVVSTAWEDVAGFADAGAVHVFYGSATPNASNLFSSYFHPLNLPLPFPVNPGLFFGATTCGGDFNGDGFDDLAIGAGGAYVSGFFGAGAVVILRGSAFGLTPLGMQVFSQDTKGIKDQVEGLLGAGAASLERFGTSLGSGDFNGDGRDDLLIGGSSESIPFGGSDRSFAGSFNVLYGSAKGLAAKGNKFFHQGSPNIPADPAENNFFGGKFAVGDFNGDAIDDVAVSAIGVDGPASSIAGNVTILYGKFKKGLTTTTAQELTEAGIGGAADNSDGSFGFECAAGDFNGDGFDDLAINCPQRTVGAFTFAGAVYVLRGSANGIDLQSTIGLDGSMANFPGTAAATEFFGNSVTSADFNADGFDDLAIGAPNDSEGGATGAGVIFVVPGSAVGLATASAAMISQNVGATPDMGDLGDGFGQTVRSADLNGDGAADLLVCANGESVDNADDAGAVFVFFGLIGSSGITTLDSFMLHEASQFIADAAEEDDWFGFYMGN